MAEDVRCQELEGVVAGGGAGRKDEYGGRAAELFPAPDERRDELGAAHKGTVHEGGCQLHFRRVAGRDAWPRCSPREYR